MKRVLSTIARPALMRIIVLAIVGAAVSACASFAGGGSANAKAKAGLDDAVFTEAYSLIHERYLRPVTVRSLAMDGLQALGDVDSGLSVDSEGGKVFLRSKAKTVREFVAPARNDASGWGDLTTAVIKASQKVSPRLAAAGPEKLYETVFDGALGKLDRYTRYAGAAEAREQRADRDGFGGIGMRLGSENGVTRVVGVMPETPAERAGIQANDIIVSVENKPITGFKLRAVVGLLRGPVGSIAHFTITRVDVDKPIKISVERAHIFPTSVIYRRDGNAGYIRITRFNQGTVDSFREKVRLAQREIGAKLTGLIIDLRDNPGGLLDQAVAVSDSLLGRGRIVSTSGRHRGSFQEYDASGRDITRGLPVIVLINGGSASASEIMTAALQDDGRAIVIGTNSYGKGVVQSVYRLPNDGELTLTWSRFHAPSGYNLQNLGILPTICTSTAVRSARALLNEVRRGDTGVATTLVTWRRRGFPSTKTRRTLRAVCPSMRVRRRGNNDLDMKIAEAVLKDRGLYAVALKQSSVPEIASRP